MKNAGKTLKIKAERNNIMDRGRKVGNERTRNGRKKQKKTI